MRRALAALVFLLSTPAAAEAPTPQTIFPLPGASRATTPYAEGHYRAFRPGRKPQRGCGRGHCGIDLHAPDGTQVVASRAGIVGQVQRGDRDRAGRWVRIQHPDGTTTWYMHLARVRDGLVAGQAVVAGELLGTLGRTGVSSSPTHLHFALSVGPPRSPRYLDPATILDGATLVAEVVTPRDATRLPSAADPSVAAAPATSPDL